MHRECELIPSPGEMIRNTKELHLALKHRQDRFPHNGNCNLYC